MGTGVNGEGGAQSSPQGVPTTGMRGGLGRTLLSVFLFLTILPLAVIGGYAVRQNHQNIQRETETRLKAIAALKVEALRQWLTDVRAILTLSAMLEETACCSREDWWAEVVEYVPALVGVVIYDSAERVVWATGACELVSPLTETFAFLDNDLVSFSVFRGGSRFAFCLSARSVEEVVRAGDEAVGERGGVYLVYDACVWHEGRCADLSPDVLNAREAEGKGRLYTNHAGVLVMGVYYPLQGLDFNGHTLGVLVEQDSAEMTASSDRIAATLVAMVLGVALLTTAIAAGVIRQITRPVIRLTESALAMAAGELDQHLEVCSRDEIGILTYVFNEMAEDLKSLYEDLEAKVAQRTAELQRVNYVIQRRALYLQASQEVSQAITSVRDPDALLRRVVDSIQDRFKYVSVAIYLVEPGGGRFERRVVSPRGATSWPTFVCPGDGSIVELAIRTGAHQVREGGEGARAPWGARRWVRVAMPLRMEDRVLGALAVLNADSDGVQDDEIDVLRLLAGQIAVALENARAYEREHAAALRLQEAEEFKRHFLSNMSHELREPLNTIIGFSRLILKGIDGPLTEVQRQDLEMVYASGQRLLHLINDLLISSQLQAGLMELRFQPVSLAEVVSSILPTVRALVRGKEIELRREIPADLPLVRADPDRLRQILVQLFTNAAKFTEAGYIALRAWEREGFVYVSVSDTGVGIPPEDRDRIFEPFERGGTAGRQGGAGLGLALCKEFVEMHGGRIWVVSEEGKGSTFTFSLPCYAREASWPDEVGGEVTARDSGGGGS